MSLDDETIRRALPELQTLLHGIASVAILPESDPGYDSDLQPLVELCQEIATKHGANDTPLMVYLIALSAAARIPRKYIREEPIQ